jgi:pyrroline-5-carboxylate reductase
MNEEGMKGALHGKLLISILAGVRIIQLRQWVTPETRVIRSMPNTPCKVLIYHVSHILFLLMFLHEIREGMTVISTLNYSTEAPELDSKIAFNIFSSIGRVQFLEEKHFDVSTAIAGSGPAFACLFLEAMADGGVMMGLPRVEALEMAAQSASVVRESG